MEENEERLQKYLARKGIASRRKCEEYIEQGLVKVNGNVVTELGTKINPSKDKIIFKRKRNKK
jgi:23S rRNA pseudouridine2605 synthase